MEDQNDWEKNGEFCKLAVEARAQTVAWMLNIINRENPTVPTNNLARSVAIIETLNEFTAGLYFTLTRDPEDNDFLILSAEAVAKFVFHLLEDHEMPAEQAGTAIDMLTFFCARIFHNMEPKT